MRVYVLDCPRRSGCQRALANPLGGSGCCAVSCTFHIARGTAIAKGQAPRLLLRAITSGAAVHGHPGSKLFPFDTAMRFSDNPSCLLNFSMPKSPNRSFAIVNLR